MTRLLSSLLLTTATALAAADNLRLEKDENTGTISVHREASPKAILTQVAGPTTRPYLHPIVAPDGKGTLTEFSPGHHKHQTGLYWGFTRVNKRDYFHNLQNAYRPSALFDFLATEDLADGLHGALAAGALERVAAPNLKDEVAPEGAHVAGSAFGRGGDEEDLGRRWFW
ncbi:MAG: hypothetical protein ACI9NQ_001565 [Paracoccaceae bacterium]|jgi:hypothetical protein